MTLLRILLRRQFLRANNGGAALLRRRLLDLVVRIGWWLKNATATVEIFYVVLGIRVMILAGRDLTRIRGDRSLILLQIFRLLSSWSGKRLHYE